MQNLLVSLNSYYTQVIN